MTSCKTAPLASIDYSHIEMSYRIIRVPFTGSVKLRSLLLKTGPGDQTPQTVSLVSTFSHASAVPTWRTSYILVALFT